MSITTANTEAVAPAGQGRGRLAALFGVLALGVSLVPLNSTMIAVALPRIQHVLHLSVAQGSWLVSLYLILMMVATPLAGLLGDRLGRRRLFLAGVLVLLVGSVGCALSSSIAPLIAFRLVQGLGAAALAPTAMAMLRFALPAARRGAAFGLLGAVIGLSSALGLPLGGALTALFDWQAIFWVNIPLGLAVLAAGLLVLPADKRSEEEEDGGVVAAVRGLLGIRAYRASVLAICLQNVVMYATLLVVPQYLEQVRKLSPGEAGGLLALFALVLTGLAPAGGLLADRLGRRAPALLASAALALGSFLLTQLASDTSLVLLFIMLCVTGAGLALGSASFRTSSVEVGRPRDSGVASGIGSTFSYLGSTVGSLLTGLFVSGQGRTVSVSGIHILFWLMTGVSIVLITVTLGLTTEAPPRSGRSRQLR